MIQINFNGALSTVGASAVLIDTGIEKIVLDYGTKIRETPPLFPIPIKGKVDAVILSHTHLDHAGGIPIFYANGNNVPIFSLPVTKPLAELLLLDSIKISREEGVELPFTKADVKTTMKNFLPVSYRKPFKLHKTKITAFDAGHIPGCLPKDTLIQLDNGEIESIDKLKKSVKVMSVNESHKVMNSDAYVWNKRSPKKLYSIKTKTSQITATPEHRFFRFGEGFEVIEAEKLRKGDYLVSIRKIPFNGNVQELPHIKQSKSKKALKINIPILATKEFCQVVGYFVGDGTISPRGIYLFDEIRKVAGHYANLFSKIFNVKYCLRKRKDTTNVVEISSVNLVKLFTKLGLRKKSPLREVPKIILRCPSDLVAFFLRGLYDAEGYVLKDCVGISSPSKKLIFQLKFLLLRFGIISHYKEKRVYSKLVFTKNPSHSLYIYDIESIKKFNQQIGFSHLQKSEKLKKLEKTIGKSRRKSKVDVFPFINQILRETCETFQKRGKFLNLRISRNDFPVAIKHFFAGHPPSRNSLRMIVEILEKKLAKINEIDFSNIYSWKNLKDIREILNISQRELGRYTNLSQHLICKYEKKSSNKNLDIGIKCLKSIKNQIIENTKENVKFLRELVDSDIFFDRILELKKVENKQKTVYDLEVNPSHNFIANGILSHNSMMPFLDFGKKTLLYTGDINTRSTRLLKKADENIPDTDILITESTYSDREHPDRKEQEKQLVQIIEDTLAVDGICFIAGFAIGRIDEILLVLDAHGIDYPVFVDGMAKKAITIINQHKNMLKIPDSLDRALEKVQYVASERMRRKIVKNPCVVLSTSGMLTGGPIVNYIKKFYDSDRCSLVLTSFQLEDTPGKILLETGRFVTKNSNLEVKMLVKRLDFSSHAGRKELFDFVKKINPEKVFCVHGDHTEEFANELKQQGFDATAPVANNRIFTV